MRKQRKVETDEQGIERNKRAAQTKMKEAKDADHAIDTEIRRSIELHGP